MIYEKEQMKYLTLMIHRDLTLIKCRYTILKNSISRKLYTPQGLIFMGIILRLMLKKSKRIRHLFVEIGSNLSNTAISYFAPVFFISCFERAKKIILDMPDRKNNNR